ncbi:MAG: macro domain-containing protein [bacterium]|nr:macro domain-containing protein [bacterium]
MKLILVDVHPAFLEAAKHYFAELPNVELVHGPFELLSDYDCMVSPANSFGLMDGGIDAAIIRYFGEDLMRRVQARIISEYLGEQPVGTCMLVETLHPRHPFLAHTPTMRVPMTIARTDNVYKAMWALLLAVHHHNQINERKIESIACPGLGTGTGQVPFRQAARQMALAYRNYLNPPSYIGWRYADARQQEIRYGGDFGCNVPPEFA